MSESTLLNLVTLAEVAAATKCSIDYMRRAAPALARAGLIRKLGSAWVALASDTQRVAEAAREECRRQRAAGAASCAP